MECVKIAKIRYSERVNVTKDEYDQLTSDEKIAIHRKEIESENSVLKLPELALLQIEHETYGAMSITFQYVDFEKLEDLQMLYWNVFVENGWMPSPIARFCEPNSEPEEYNAAGSMSGAFIEIARIRLNLPREVTEL